MCGFNLKRFDLKVLIAEFNRVGRPFTFNGRKILDPLQIFHDRERRDLSAALRFYCGREHQGAHGATADVRATLEILDAMVERYPDLPRSVDGLHETLLDEGALDLDGKFVMVDGHVIFNFGNYKGKRLDEIAQDAPTTSDGCWELFGSLDNTKELVLGAIDRATDAKTRSRAREVGAPLTWFFFWRCWRWQRPTRLTGIPRLFTPEKPGVHATNQDQPATGRGFVMTASFPRRMAKRFDLSDLAKPNFLVGTMRPHSPAITRRARQADRTGLEFGRPADRVQRNHRR